MKKKARLKSIVITIPPIAPSTLFFGLIFGASLCLPNFLPTKYANVSLSHADSSAVKIIKNTCDCWNRSGRLRQRFLSRVIVDITSFS